MSSFADGTALAWVVQVQPVVSSGAGNAEFLQGSNTDNKDHITLSQILFGDEFH